MAPQRWGWRGSLSTLWTLLLFFLTAFDCFSGWFFPTVLFIILIEQDWILISLSDWRLIIWLRIEYLIGYTDWCYRLNSKLVMRVADIMMKCTIRRGSWRGNRGYLLLFIWLLQRQDLRTRLSLLRRNGFFLGGLERRLVVWSSHNCEWDWASLRDTLFRTTVVTLSAISSKIKGYDWGFNFIFCIPVIIIGSTNEWIPIFSLLITHAFAYYLSLIPSIWMLLVIRVEVRAISNVLGYQTTCVKNHRASRLIDSVKIPGALEWPQRLWLRLVADRARLNLRC